jgi:hypothetical protein
MRLFFYRIGAEYFVDTSVMRSTLWSALAGERQQTLAA